MLKQYEHIMIAKELGTFHAVEKMYYNDIALYLLESDLDKNHCIIVDENLAVLQKNVRSFSDFELDFDSPVSTNFDETIFAELKEQLQFLNTRCLNNEIDYTELVKCVNDTISDVACQIHDLAELGVLSDVQIYILNAMLQSVINEAFTNIESPNSEQYEESDDENY